MIYRRCSSPLHAARASIGAAYCGALVLASLLSSDPLVLGALGAAVVFAAVLAGVGDRIGRALRFAAPMGLLIVIVNGLVSRNGLTVLARLGEFGPLGQVDVTLEALVDGARLALELTVVLAVSALASAAINPDELLRSLRRTSFRSALTATLATRIVPLLARDARRIGEAQRSRSAAGVGRVVILRAITANALDRAVDVAATLEVRGYGSARRPPRIGRPLSRHDLAFAAAAVAITVTALAGALLNIAPFTYYPTISAGGGAGPAVLAGTLFVLTLLPFCQRSGTMR